MTGQETASGKGTEMEYRTDEDARAKVREMAGKAKFAMLATYDRTGTAHSRPMVASAFDDDVLWFFTRAESRKVEELSRDPRVTVDYADGSGQNYASLVGTAEIRADRATIDRLWSEPMRTWFPEGKDDPAIRLVRVTVDSAEYWDTPSSSMVHAFGYVKARLTGEPPAPGETAHVEM